MKRSIALVLCCLTLPLLNAIGQPDTLPTRFSATLHDVVVYGDSSGAVVAAIAAKRERRSVICVNPTGGALREKLEVAKQIVRPEAWKKPAAPKKPQPDKSVKKRVLPPA